MKKILVDGKEFMTGDTKTAMKNLPTSIVEKVKAYDQQSDLARVTGIDDGEEETVLDFGIKKGMNKGLLSNVDLSIGTKDRYSERLMAGLFNDKSKVMLLGDANNVNDMGFGAGSRGGFGQQRQGLNASKMLGVNFNYSDKGKLQMDGSLRWNHSNGDLQTSSSSENFLSTNASFSNSLSQKYTRSNSWDFRYRLEWQPDSMTNIMFRPNAQYSTSDGLTSSTSAAYNDNPYNYTNNPLAKEDLEMLRQNGALVNTQDNDGITYGETKSVGAMLQINRKLNSNGRNFTLRGDVKWSDSESTSFSLQNVRLYQVLNSMDSDSTYQHYCSNAQCKEREPALDEIHHSESEQGAKDYGQDEQWQGIPIAEADEDKYEHDDECTKQCGGQIVFDGRGVIVTAGGSTMITDADIGVRLSETFNFVVEHLEQSVALSSIGGRKSWSDKGNANSTVGHEEMSVNSFEATLRSGEKWLHPLSQQVAHAHGIHLYEFGIGRAKLAFHVFAVFRHADCWDRR